jgi:two-component system response regulator
MKEKVILLVEDNADDEALTLRALQHANLSTRVDVVRDGEEALDYLFCRGSYAKRNCSEKPVVVFLDVKLPKLDGADVVKEIKSNDITRHIPVVMLTTSTQASDMVRCYDNGANSYIQKPIDFHDFMQIVTLLGAYWLTLNSSPED